MKRLGWIPWRWWRRIVQLLLLALFVWLFRRAESTGIDNLAGGENLFFRLDPLAAASAMAAARMVLWVFWPAAIVLALTAVLGRFFCGWACPLGTLLDAWGFLIRPLARRTGRLARTRALAPIMRKARWTRYFVLLACLLGAAMAFPLVGLADPFSLLVRAMTFWGDPAFYNAADAALTWTGRASADPVRHFFVKHLLPFRANAFDLAAVSAAIVAAILGLELVARRFWCRYLCPLGAMYGLVGRFSLVRRLPAKVCKGCGRCAADCRMDALGDPGGLSGENCTLCMDCVDACPRGIVTFVPRLRRPAGGPMDVSRRGLLAAAVAGAALPGVGTAVRRAAGGQADASLLRPPGVGDERTFLNLCVRCGLCMKVCPTNVLQPAALRGGLEGLFAPRMMTRFIFEQTYCEYNCNLCGQVCPTGAIPPLTVDQKHRAHMGKAYFDHARCLPWAKHTSCIRCEEVCPLPDKAIKIQNTFTVKDDAGEDVEIQQPHVNRDLCTGCGFCESNCPIDGPAGIRVRRVDASDPRTEFLRDQPPPASAPSASQPSASQQPARAG